ncbi:MAG TPA: hypothetical protein PLP83_01330 [Candidatus Aminicenantes bacterium]|nr:hypothetical protein [Candidatus Aminicenantes bacterium]
MRLSKRSFVIIALAAAVAAAGALAAAPQKKASPRGPVKVENTDPALRLKAFDEHTAMKRSSPFQDVRWRFIGPFDLSGRCTDVAVPAGSRTVFYAGAASGGIFKTVNAGTTWEPIFENMPTMSIGDLAVAESDPSIVWAGTGEANIFRGSMAGFGVYKSTDAGKTWAHMGLEATYTIARVVIHPENPDIVYVAATGHEWTYNPERGVYKTTDGGRTWAKVLYVNEKVGANDLVMDPRNPDTLYAATWNRIRLRWSDPRPGGEDGLYKTTDGGRTWTPINNGLPDTAATGRIGIDLCRTKPSTLYAYVDNHTPGVEPKPGERDAYGRPKQRGIVGAEVYRSDDAGASWRKVSPGGMENFGGTYGWVFGQIRVDPSNPETVYIMGLGLSKSTDGGKSFSPLTSEGLHGDHHSLWIDPDDPDHLLNANDGGVNISYDGGRTWRDFHDGIPAVQFYNVALDNSTPFYAYGSVQDQNSHRGRIQLRRPAAGGPAAGRRQFDALARAQWVRAPGGEGTLHAIDPSDPRTVYSSSFYGRLERAEYGDDGAWTSKEIYPKAAEGEPAYRGQWLAGLALSPHNPQVVYHGFQYLFRSMNRGETWERISPDLTYNNPAQQGQWPFAIPFATITAVDESPFKFGLVYVGTDDGRVWVTRNSGDSWTELTAGLPYNKHVWKVVASKYDPATVYVTLVGRHDDDFNPYVFKSVDYGKTWASIAAGIPGGPVNVVREDPKVKDILYAGTDTGVYVSRDGGKSWNVLGGNLPTSYVWDIAVHPRDNALVIATNGRGMWIVDDLGPVQNAAK